MITLLLIAASLCADCFAVSLCSSISLKDANNRQIIITGLVFAIIQSGLLICGWLFGNLFVGLVEKIAHIIGFAMLLYVGLGMLLDGIKAKGECHNLNGWKNIIMGGIATSIDAAAVGVSQSMDAVQSKQALILCLFVFIITFISVFIGINIGKTIACKGRKVSRIAEILGGIILIGIGVGILI